MLEILLESHARRPGALGPGAVAASVQAVLFVAATLGGHSQVAPTGNRSTDPGLVYVAEWRAAKSGVNGSSKAPGSPPAPPISGKVLLPSGPMLPDQKFDLSLDPDSRGTAKLLASRGVWQDLVNDSGPREGRLLLANEPVSVLTARTPHYPREMEAAGVSGRVRLEFIVDTLGQCEAGSLRVIESSQPAFEQAARASVLGTIFRPARAGGIPVRQLVRQTLVFAVTP